MNLIKHDSLNIDIQTTGCILLCVDIIEFVLRNRVYKVYNLWKYVLYN